MRGSKKYGLYIAMIRNVSQSIQHNQFIYVNTWDGVAPVIRALSSCVKRMTIKIVNRCNTFKKKIVLRDH